MEETTNYGLKLIEDSDDYTDIFDDHNDSMEIIDTELAKKLESVPVMTGSTALTDGTEGLAPKPLAGETNRFLRADGTWTVPAGSGDSQVGIYTIDATIPVSSWVAGTNDYSVTISDQTIISTMTVIEWGITNETEANPLMLGETNVTVGAGTLTITTAVIPVASWTVHIDLGTDGSNVLNEVAGKADQELLGYREDGNTASRTIADGSFVVWKGGLYKASASIPQGTAFSLSNLTAVTSGGFNDLQSSVSSLSDSIAWKHHSKTQGTSVSVPENATEYNIIAIYGTSSGEQNLCFVFTFPNLTAYNGKVLTQGYSLPSGSGFCQLSVNASTHTIVLTGFYINGTDYKDTCYLDVYYR